MNQWYSQHPPSIRCKRCENGYIKVSLNRFLDFNTKREKCPICHGTGWIGLTKNDLNEGLE